MVIKVNVMEKMELQKQVLLSYSVVYPDRHDKIEDLLANVPSNTAIELISYNLSKKVNQFIGEHDFDIWAPWIMKTRNDVKNPVGQYAQQYNLGNYALIDKYAMLLLISRLLTCYNGRNEELTEDDLSNLFLAYMLCCDERLAMNEKLPNNNMKAEEFVESYMPDCLKSNNIEAPRDYRLLMIKCYMLLIEFPKFNTRVAQYVDEFCKERDIPSAKYYLDEIFLTFLEMGKEDFSNCRMAIGENQKDASRFYDSLTLNPSHYQHDMDFLMMKEKPLIKTGPNIYNFMFMKMFLDKAYTGLCFDVEGPNYLLNKEFQRIISEKNVTADYEVKDVVMVNIEQLMRLENFFAAEKLDLAYLINSYIEYKEEFELNQVYPFNKYIFQEARKVGYELKKTRWFDEVFENLKIMDRKGL